MNHHPCTDQPTAGGVVGGRQSSVRPQTLGWDQPRYACPLTALACMGSLSLSQVDSERGMGKLILTYKLQQSCSANLIKNPKVEINSGFKRNIACLILVWILCHPNQSPHAPCLFRASGFPARALSRFSMARSSICATPTLRDTVIP